MKHFLILGGIAAAGLAASTVSTAQSPARPVDVTRAQAVERSDAAFARLDANRDGRFTREEAQALR
ncbi:MAG TPA: hypothetical protein VMG08_03795 [Allosphingosinicella sp.]|nr:hypothetical protein [Allosphingosinicella sp.]